MRSLHSSSSCRSRTTCCCPEQRAAASPAAPTGLQAAAFEVTTDNTCLLQNMGELMEHTELLDKAAACEDPYER